MLRRAVNVSRLTSNAQPQPALDFRKHLQQSDGKRPLDSNPSLVNAQRTIDPPKRCSSSLHTSSTVKSLAQLHQKTVFVDENEFDDFDDDALIELEAAELNGTSVAPPKELSYPSLPPNDVSYPTIPPSTPSQNQQSSSMPVPWSTSPVEHLSKPTRSTPSPSAAPKQEHPGTKRPLSLAPGSDDREEVHEATNKRRKLPWGGYQKAESEGITPVAKEKVGSDSYPWDKSFSAVRNDQKDFKRRAAAKVVLTKNTHAEKTANLPATHLSEEQSKVVKVVVEEGKSVFFTGSAGTGKSVLMRSIIARLRQKYCREPDRFAITASTGLAACVIEGTTLHSWAGIGLGKEPVAELCKRIKRNAKTKTKWLRTKVLIIDEVSMVDGELFDKLEQIARTVRNNGRPFGGIQLVITGDFFQLPPVPDRSSVAKFAFDAGTWSTCIEHTILLTHVFRQKDPVFANMLNEMRLGNISNETIKQFQQMSRPLTFENELEATELFPTRSEVENANSTRMKRLAGEEMVFKAVDSGINDLNARNKILANFMAPESLTLKKGAQVMLIKNIDSQLVNGTLGKVIAFMDEGCYAAYKDDEETYHLAHEKPGGENEEEKAAARARFNAARFKNRDGPQPKYWPMIRFPLQDGTYRDMLCLPEEWKTENQQQEITAKRVQVPLILAWALSIHKAQGQTLSRVKVDLGKVFEKGQAYVALSRATTKEGLQVLRFDAKKVMVHPKVTHFYQKLRDINSVLSKGKKQSTLNAAGVLPRAGCDVGDVDEEEYQDDEHELTRYG